MRRTLHHLMTHPRRLLLLDAVGALITALATTLLLAAERITTGLPTETLYVLGAVAACFACFDVAALQLRVSPSIALRAIACANLSYCVATAALLSVHHAAVTAVGFAYFLIEIPIVVALAAWEWKIAARQPAP